MPEQHHDAAKARSARLGFRVIAQGLEQLRVILGITLARPRVARGINPGGPSKRVDFEPRIIGKCRKPRKRTRITGLDDGVFDKRQACLLGFRHLKVRLRDPDAMVICEHTRNLGELAAVP